MFEHEIRATRGVNRGKVHRIGYGWPSQMRRWCTRVKIQSFDSYCKGMCQREDVGEVTQCIGFAADEAHRRFGKTMNEKGMPLSFPLVDMGISEADALAYCQARGFTWGGLYEHFDRVSCYCCPLQSPNKLRVLRTHYPHLWETMMSMEDRMSDEVLKRFHGDHSVRALDGMFAKEVE